MSKRFGRNQKRHMREALAAEQLRVQKSEQKAQAYVNIATRQGDELDHLKAFFEEVAHRVGRESILVNGAVTTQVDALTRRFTIAAEQEMSLMMVPHISETAAMKYLILLQLETKAVRDAFKSQVVAMCYIGESASAAMALSEEYIARSTDDEIVRRIVPEIARHLVKQLRTLDRR